MLLLKCRHARKVQCGHNPSFVSTRQHSESMCSRKPLGTDNILLHCSTAYAAAVEKFSEELLCLILYVKVKKMRHWKQKFNSNYR